MKKGITKWSIFTLAVLLAAIIPAVWAESAQEDNEAEWFGFKRAGRYGRDREHGYMERFRNDGDYEKYAERIQSAVAELSEIEPEISGYVDRLKQSENPRRMMFMKHLCRDFPGKGMLDDPELKQLAARHLKLELQSLVLAEDIQTGEGDKTAYKEQLKKVIAEAFEQKQLLRAHRLKKLEQILQESKDELSYRNENKDQIIEQRYEMLLQERIDW